METLYLVDGSGYIYRAFYAIAALSNSKGQPTNAIFGFWRMMSKLLRDSCAKHIAVAFDTPTPTFRHERYELYKANRAECPAELVQQMPYFRKVVRALNIPCLEKPGVEADDILATISHTVTDAKIIIVSGDKDLCQLVDSRTEVWDAMRDIRYDTDGVVKKFGVTPQQMIDFLALTGDASDNVPGVRGIGPKTAQQLLQHFGSIDKCLERLEDIGQVKGLRGASAIRQKLESAAEDLRLSRELVSLIKDVEPFSSEKSVQAYAWQGPDRQQLVPLFQELEFGLEDELVKSAPAAAPCIERRVEIVTNESLPAFAQLLAKQSAFALDTETTSFDPLSCVLVGLAVSWEEGLAYYLPLGGEVEKERILNRDEVQRLIGPILADPKIRKSGSNLKFDFGVLECQGFKVQGLAFDTMLASYVLTPDRRQHGVKQLAKIQLGENMLTYDDVLKDSEHIGQVPIDSVAAYCGQDAEVSGRLAKVLDSLLGAAERRDDGKFIPSLRKVFEEIEMPLVPVLSQMERTGIRVDLELLKRLEEEFEKELQVLEGQIYGLAGEEFNLNSPRQLSCVLFEKLGLPTAGVKKTQSAYSTDAAVLDKLAPDHEIAAKIIEYREVFKLKTTYVDALQLIVNPKTGRIHTSFNQAVAATGRLSSSEPNLQNIPIRQARGRRIREAFVPEPGHVFISADYSQIELRVLAHLSGDKSLSDAFRRDEDIHLATAKELLGAAIASPEELKDLRRVAKTINFGVVYGISAFRLSNELRISRRQAQQFIDGYFARYPRVSAYFDELEKFADEKGYVETMFGRRRFLRDINTSGRDAGYATRSLMNAPIQGTAAEIIKIAMINLAHRLEQYGRRARLVLQVHDELVVEAEQPLAEEIEQIVTSEMTAAVKLSVPLKVDVRLANKWG